MLNNRKTLDTTLAKFAGFFLFFVFFVKIKIRFISTLCFLGAVDENVLIEMEYLFFGAANC